MDQSHHSVVELVLQLDREFDLATAAGGAQAWVSYFAEDGEMVPAKGEVVRGHAAILQAMSAAFALPEFSLRWSPESGRAAWDGSLVYTYGRYLRSYRDTSGRLVQTSGRYLTVWARQADGSWRIVLDMGN